MGSDSYYAFQEVLKNVFIGSQLALLRPFLLISKKITHILAVNGTKEAPTGFTFKSVALEDEEEEDILSKLPECISFIKSTKGAVLVICTAGRSRSASVVAAYLIKERGMSLAEALMTINRVRAVRPNPGFMIQLGHWEEQHKCALCKLEHKTRWFEETEQFAVMECDQCECPMVVLKVHTNRISPTLAMEMRSALARAATSVFGSNWQLDTLQRTIPHHLHWHARPDLLKQKL